MEYSTPPSVSTENPFSTKTITISAFNDLTKTSNNNDLKLYIMWWLMIWRNHKKGIVKSFPIEKQYKATVDAFSPAKKCESEI